MEKYKFLFSTQKGFDYTSAIPMMKIGEKMQIFFVLKYIQHDNSFI